MVRRLLGTLSLLCLATSSGAFVSIRPQLLGAHSLGGQQASCANRANGLSLRMVAVAPDVKPLSELPMQDYIDQNGLIPFDPANGNVGVFAIYDKEQTLRFIGQSRYCDNSLRLHLGRMPSECYHYKIQTVKKPSRTILDEIKKAWVAEAGQPSDNDGSERQRRWEHPIDVRQDVDLKADEEQQVADMGRLNNQEKVLRAVTRRVQADVESVLIARGCKEKLSFAPKLKAQGLLDIASVKIAEVKSIGKDTSLDESLVQPK